MSITLIICSREPIRTRIIHSIYAALEKLFMDFMQINQNSLQLYLYTLFWLWLLCYWLVFYSWGGWVELSIGSFDANLLTTSQPLTCKCFSQSSSLSSGETTKSLEFRKWPETGETANPLNTETITLVTDRNSTIICLFDPNLFNTHYHELVK